jgi:hypothetical protein
VLEFVPQAYWIIIAASLIVLAVVLVGRRRSHWPAALVSLGLAAVILWRFLGAPVDMGTTVPVIEVEPAGSLPWGLIGLLYLAMLAGMAAQYVYLKSERARFRWHLFVKPVLLSPVVFLPLLAGLQDHLDGGPWNLARLMLLFIAFQNGFFWKTLFDAQAGRIRSTS